jgi:hypothetical protein
MMTCATQIFWHAHSQTSGAVIAVPLFDVVILMHDGNAAHSMLEVFAVVMPPNLLCRTIHESGQFGC